MPLIHTTTVSKSFGGVRALEGVTFTVEAGENRHVAPTDPATQGFPDLGLEASEG